MKAVERRGGAMRESRRNMRGVKSMGNVPQMRGGKTGNTRRREDMVPTPNDMSRLLCNLFLQDLMEISNFIVNHAQSSMLVPVSLYY